MVSLLNFLRLILLEAPLGILCGCVAIGYGAEYFYNEFYTPYIESVEWNSEWELAEQMYYNRICEEEDFSASSIQEMVVPSNATDGIHQAIHHGSVVFRDVVTKGHADDMRTHVLERNSKLSKYDVDYIGLISNRNRWSYKIDIDDDSSIEKVMQDIAGNSQLVNTLEGLLGPDPALVELTAITSAYGAGNQHFHKDNSVEMTLQQMGRTYADMYSVFIPLQDTTKEMGATAACPGFHICKDEDQLCNEDTALIMADDNNVWHAGDAWIFQLSTDHRGPAHVDPNSGERVMLVLTFTGRPGTIEDDRRIPSLHTSWSLKMQMSGLSLHDLADKRSNWPWWRKLGAWTGWRQHSFDYIQFSAIRIINQQFQYQSKHLVEHLKRMNQAGTGDNFAYNFWAKIRSEIFGGSTPSMPLHHDSLFEVGEEVEIVRSPGTVESGVIVKQLEDSRYAVRKTTDDKVIELHAGRICKQGRCSKFLPWRGYIEQCIENLKEKSFGALVKVLWIYAYVLVFSLIVSQSRIQILVRALFSIALFTSPFLMLIGGWMHRIQESHWGKQIRSGSISDRPFLDPSIRSHWQLPKISGPTIFPFGDDVLFSTRLGSPGFAQRNDHLDTTHPGNTRYKMYVEDLATVYSRQTSLFREAIITSIHQDIREHMGTFLLQNEYGDWVYMAESESRKFTHRELMENGKASLASLAGRVRELKSELRHGKARKTAMYRIHAPAFINCLENQIFNGDEVQNESVLSRPPFGKGRFFFPRMGRLNPSAVTHSSSKGQKNITGSLQGLKPYYLQEGDSVVAYDGKKWLQGKILQVQAQTSKYGQNMKYVIYRVQFKDGRLKLISDDLVRYHGDGIVVEGTIEGDDDNLIRFTRIAAHGRIQQEEFVVV